MKKYLGLKWLLALAMTLAITAHATDRNRADLADDVETPDPLLQRGGSDSKVYGDDQIYVREDGYKDNEDNRPDALERSVRPKQQDSGRKKKDTRVFYDDPNKPKKTEKPSARDKRDDSIETPDNLLDNL